MNFVSTQFLIFIFIVFFIYWNLPHSYQNIFLTLASYYFYASWNWRFLSLIIISTLVDFISGSKTYNAKTSATKKFWLIFSIVVNIGILGYFKYFNFFADSLASLASTLGWSVSKTTLDIILPVGISFYTFQTMSYTIDIYRGQLKPTKSLVDFAAFVSFFPQLVAGPIVRAREFIFQLEQKRNFNGKNLETGLTRFLLGFFKKAFIADTLAVYLVDPVFQNPANYRSGILWLALLGYTVQIYADFSGYSSMAIGTARILGFEIPENFTFPYLAKNFSDFWRRWHMTMSRFFKDYVYIALGGNRCNTKRIILNLAITTLLSGLWHGASWNFVIWGGMHGLFITIYQFWRKWKLKRGMAIEPSGRFNNFFALIITQIAVCLSWVMFRSQDFKSFWIYLKGIFHSAGSNTLEIPVLVWVSFTAFLIDHLYGWLEQSHNFSEQQIPLYLRATIYSVMIIFLFNARPEEINPFIYFQF